MTGFIPPQDFRFANNGFQMVRVRGKELPGSLEELGQGDPDSAKGTHRITCRSTAVDVGDEVQVVGNASYIVAHVSDPYRSKPSMDRSMFGRYVAMVANLKGA